MALKDLENIQPMEHTGRSPKAKGQKGKRQPRTKKPKKVKRGLGHTRRLCEGCGGRLRGGHVVENSGKDDAIARIYCRDCR